MAVDKKYPVLNRGNLMRPIQMQLFQKQKTFSEFLAGFLKCRLTFWYFETKYDSYRFCISKITASENVVREMPKKSCFRGPSEKQHGKGVQALLKSALQHVYQI